MINVTRDTEYLTSVSSVSKESGLQAMTGSRNRGICTWYKFLRSLSISCSLAHMVQDGFNFLILSWHWFKSLGCLNFWEKDDTCRQWVKARLLLTLLQGPGTLQNSFQPPMPMISLSRNPMFGDLWFISVILDWSFIGRVGPNGMKGWLFILQCFGYISKYLEKETSNRSWQSWF